jgi:ornithine--oxo-acid transaminase
MKFEEEYGAHNYHPIPVVIARGQGVNVWDPEGKQYYDFLSAYSAVNQGHCHPKIVQALMQQAQTCTLTSRAFYNDIFPRFAKFVTEYFGYDMILPMNTGAEGVETAMKIARKWGYSKKGIPDNDAIIISANECFHGRTIAVISMSTDASAKSQFGPLTPGHAKVPFNDLDALRRLLEEKGPRVCAFLVEPIQGEAGVVVPDEGYLRGCYELCKKHNVLFIADEIQTGLCRTGRLLACDHEEVRPDMLILGKALGGGVFPVSCVLADRDVMLCIRPGEHGSTFGGNPLASAVAMASLEVLRDEKLAENAERQGEKLRRALRDLQARCPFIQKVRGRGLLNAVVIDPNFASSAWDICVFLKDHGLLAKPTHDNIIRFAPPLIINDEQLEDCIAIIRTVFTKVVKMNKINPQ